MTMLGGAVGFGVAQKASGQQPSTLSAMPYASTPLSGAELTYIVQGGISKKTPISTIPGTPGGSSSQIQYNNSGTLGGYNVGSGLLVVGNNLTAVGGTGTLSVVSVAALQALPTSTGAVAYLNSGGRSGQFAWSSANLSTQVTNDPGQGIYAAPASAPTGASGAWVRQYSGAWVDFVWWGGIGDGATENHLAWVNWSWWARQQSALGNGVRLIMQPGLYLTDVSQCFYVFANILDFELSAYGASFQNTSTTFATPFFVAASPLRDGSQNNVYQRWLINNTTPGATAFTTLTSTDASNLTSYLAQGSAWVMLGSVAIQIGGFPPSLHRFDYLKIVTVTQYASASILSAVYTSGNLALTFAAAPLGAAVGATLNGAFVPINSLTGTGSFASLNGTWAIVSTASAGTVINLKVPFGLTATVTGGTLGPVGAATTDRPIKYAHLASFPDDLPPPTGGGSCGAAGVWFLDTPNWSTRTFPNQQPGAPTYPFSIWKWDIKHIYRGLNLLVPTNFPTSIEIQFGGRYLETYDWKGIGASDSVSMLHRHEGANYSTPGEPDKLNQNLEFVHCTWPPNSANVPNAAFTMQSTSNEVASFDDCYFPEGTSGGVKVTKYTNCVMGALSSFAGPGLGLSYSIEVTNSRIFGMSPPPFYSGSLVANDGTNVTYSNGTFTISKTASGGVFYFQWGTAVPGQQLYLNPAPGGSPQFAGNAGVGYITSIAQDSTHWIVNTTLPYATLPSWATGHSVLLVRTGEVNIRGCSGSKLIEQASEACQKGFFPWEYTSFRWAGPTWPISQSSTNAGGNQTNIGILEKIMINVLQASTSGNADKLTMSFTLIDGAAFTSLGTLSLVIDVTRLGVRTLTQTSFTGTGGADAFTLAASPITALPANGLVTNFSNWSFNYNQTQYPSYQMPTIEWENKFDTGAYQKIMVNPDEIN